MDIFSVKYDVRAIFTEEQNSVLFVMHEWIGMMHSG